MVVSDSNIEWWAACRTQLMLSIDSMLLQSIYKNTFMQINVMSYKCYMSSGGSLIQPTMLQLYLVMIGLLAALTTPLILPVVIVISIIRSCPSSQPEYSPLPDSPQDQSTNVVESGSKSLGCTWYFLRLPTYTLFVWLPLVLFTLYPMTAMCFCTYYSVNLGSHPVSDLREIISVGLISGTEVVLPAVVLCALAGVFVATRLFFLICTIVFLRDTESDLKQKYPNWWNPWRAVEGPERPPNPEELHTLTLSEILQKLIKFGRSCNENDDFSCVVPDSLLALFDRAITTTGNTSQLSIETISSGIMSSCMVSGREPPKVLIAAFVLLSLMFALISPIFMFCAHPDAYLVDAPLVIRGLAVLSFWTSFMIAFAVLNFAWHQSRILSCVISQQWLLLILGKNTVARDRLIRTLKDKLPVLTHKKESKSFERSFLTYLPEPWDTVTTSEALKYSAVRVAMAFFADREKLRQSAWAQFLMLAIVGLLLTLMTNLFVWRRYVVFVPVAGFACSSAFIMLLLHLYNMTEFNRIVLDESSELVYEWQSYLRPRVYASTKKGLRDSKPLVDILSEFDVMQDAIKNTQTPMQIFGVRVTLSVVNQIIAILATSLIGTLSSVVRSTASVVSLMADLEVDLKNKMSHNSSIWT